MPVYFSYSFITVFEKPSNSTHEVPEWTPPKPGNEQGEPCIHEARITFSFSTEKNIIPSELSSFSVHLIGCMAN